MATLVLTALGTAIGGPIGGLVGAMIGQQVDMQIFAGGTRQGPRLRELAISTSSYGQPIARHFGRMRVPGSVIWSTELIESQRKDKGRKGQPSTTVFSYTASFAVALSSTPLARLGRIWADGNLLRGAQGDLKVGGSLRFYPGFGDDPVDPLIAAAKGAAAPAFRDCAYVVFESIELGDYGNRIPALSFEIFAAGSENKVSLEGLVPAAAIAATPLELSHALGFADEGGPLASTLAAIDQVIPLICTSGSDGLIIAPRTLPASQMATLPQSLGRIEGAAEESRNKQRAGIPTRRPAALRYYDDERDYQPGVQRAVGARQSGREMMIDLPATMTASGARQLATDSANRARWQHEAVVWRISELDPRLAPGTVVSLPDSPGMWLIRSWEWLDRGIDLELERLAPGVSARQISDPGESLSPADRVIPPTQLVVIEAPASDNANPATALIYACASAENSAWRGAALYAVQGTALVEIGTTGAQRAIIGSLAEPLAPSPALLFEPAASATIEFVADDFTLSDTDTDGLAAGVNRMMIGAEVIQFARAVPLGGRQWRVSGLLRGRGGTEQAAVLGHPAQTVAVLLDERLVLLDPGLAPPLATTRIAAIGTNDAEAVIAPLTNPGVSRRPLFPVHPRMRIEGGNVRVFSWTRRARGQWSWDNAVDVPLVEERELYLAGYGSEQAPFRAWTLTKPELRLTEAEAAEIVTLHGAANLWVKQIGTYDLSQALLLQSLT